ncbi:MAG: 16S rRNA (cytosine(967)-C(5))-methyltransferase RsmB [Oceanospirillaceae bacterium]|nr:16S rRNA (cytosine(967)-C(5))-methyltransferase RsmB [Oceanospirillaceae bacterium]
MNARYLAVKALTPLLNNQGALKYTLKKQLQLCPEGQRPYLQELCYGTMRHFPSLEAILDQLVTKPIRKKDVDIKVVLLIGIYQLYKLNTADHAVVSETVDVCKTLNKQWATSFVNAALRSFLRKQEEITTALDNNISFKYNHPEWFVQKLMNNWPDHWQQILEANDAHPPLTLRINTAKVSRETFLSELEEQELQGHHCKYSEYGVTLSKPMDITQILGFDEGKFSVQDEAAQLAAQLISPAEGDNILDACSAPGGKLIHLLELSSGTAKIQGLELEPLRAERIIENFERLNLSCPLHIADATKQDWWDGKLFNKILLDAPCSATGVIRRNPDIKLLRQPEDIHSIAKLQKQILENMWSMLAEGGIIVYATCSIFPQENEKIVAAFIRNNENAQHQEIKADWGTQRDFGRQLFPQQGGHDGFYYAMIKKQTINL